MLVRNAFSLVSAGTERSSVETAQASLVGKAKKRPDLVKQVRDNVKREGLLATWEKVKNRLDNYAQLGYSSAGVVMESSVAEFQPGDRVACAGAGYASHAEIIFVPKNLVAKIPQDVSFDQAVYTTLGAIAMQGVRQTDVRVGESAAVIGLGLLGLISVQILKASGCRVIGLDVSDTNFDLAKSLGCDLCLPSTPDSIPAINSFTRGYGTDAVVITAATNSNEPVELAINMARKKSPIVIVGAVGMKLPRSPFYEKELDLRISCSYGPGRYDREYEEQGQDYPIGHVRWTENRNMEAVLDLIAAGRLDVKALTTHIFPVDQAIKAYDLITNKTHETYRGILITYPESGDSPSRIEMRKMTPSSDKLKIGFIGAGNFAQSYLLPPLQKKNALLGGIMTTSPVKAKSAAKKFGFEFCASGVDDVLADSDAIFIASRHDSHASYVLKALDAGKHVFAEKPLAIDWQQLSAIKDAYLKTENLVLQVGFNRRYSPPFGAIKSFFANGQDPMMITYRVNAGFIPKDHWTQAPDQGGRLIGECCHFIDCMSYLTDSLPVSVFAQCQSSNNSQATDADNVSIVLKFSDGSVGTVVYAANGDSGLGKEYCEVSCGGRTAVMNNFRSVDFFQQGRKKSKKFDGGKGHEQEVEAYLSAINGKESSIPFKSLYLTTLATIEAVNSLRTNEVRKLEFNATSSE